MKSNAKWWQAVLLTALAGGMGWGIRGQYGHETGAMIAGVLVSLTLALLFAREGRPVRVARAVAWGTVAMGIGGSMTYGQTIGLTQNAHLIGNWEALRWGMLGLSVKGALWIGFCGLFLGMGLGGVAYTRKQVLVMMAMALSAFYIGWLLLNQPFEPASETVPRIYFSETRYWKPVGEISSRPEVWGGMLAAFLAAILYAGAWKKDGLAWRLALYGLVGGAIGFPTGQTLQAYHAWNPDVFKQGVWVWLDPNMNWWNMMETTFGAIMGAMLGLGLWINRRRVNVAADQNESNLHPVYEWAPLAVHVLLLIAVEFMAVPAVDRVYDLGLILAFIPLVMITGGRVWPYAMIFPVTLLPIAGKTLRELVYGQSVLGAPAGWVIYVIIPLVIFAFAAVWFERKSRSEATARQFLSKSLLLTTWTYFLLNYAFFRFPWPWAQWTSRTPNAIIFTVCALGLTAIALAAGCNRCRAGGKQ